MGEYQELKVVHLRYEETISITYEIMKLSEGRRGNLHRATIVMSLKEKLQVPTKFPNRLRETHR